MLRDCIEEAEKAKQTDKYTQERLKALRDFFETTTGWYTQVRQWPTQAMVKFVKLGDKALKLLGG